MKFKQFCPTKYQDKYSKYRRRGGGREKEEEEHRDIFRNIFN